MKHFNSNKWNSTKIYIYTLLFFVLVASGCKKEPNIIKNNTPPDYTFIPTVTIENYVNKIYLDLLGRDALPSEMQRDVALLKQHNLNDSIRIVIVTRLQNDTTFSVGDSSYYIAYCNRFYSMLKNRMLEGVEDDYIDENIGTTFTELNGATQAGDSAKAAKARMKIQGMRDVLAIRYDQRGSNGIGLDSIYFRLLNNWVYDQINMNTFNFINASFDNLFYRFPTNNEFEVGYAMVENNESGSLLGLSGSSRSDYLYIMTRSQEFYEGLVTWCVRSLLSRNPNANEFAKLTPLIQSTKNYRKLQIEIMKTDEYANIK